MPQLACSSVASAVSLMLVALFCDVTTKLEGQRRTLANGPKNMIVALKLERELRLVNVGTGIRDHGDICVEDRDWKGVS